MGTQEKESIMAVWCEMKIPSLGLTVRHRGTVTLMTGFSIRTTQSLQILILFSSLIDNRLIIQLTINNNSLNSYIYCHISIPMYVVSLSLQLYLHLLSYFRSYVCGISEPPALLTSIVIFPFLCMWYLWASSFTYIYCHISVPMYVVSLGLQLYLHLLSYFCSNVCGISGPPALLTSIVIFPFQCMWYLWASSFTYIYCHISFPMYVVSLGLQFYISFLPVDLWRGFPLCLAGQDHRLTHSDLHLLQRDLYLRLKC